MGERSLWRRDVSYFIAGPGLLAALSVALFTFSPWPVPIPSQAATLQPTVVAVLLAAGIVGVGLSSRAGFPSAPRLGDGRAWIRIAVPTLIAGAGFGSAMLASDAATHFTSSALKALGASWINVPLPWSLPHYGAAAVLLEVIYRLVPLPVLTLFFGVLLKGRGASQVFWGLAILTSTIEPMSLLALGRPGALAALLGPMAIAFAANVFEALEMKRLGWPAPILFRLSLYGVWHCFGPYLLPRSSVLYPGLH